MVGKHPVWAFRICAWDTVKTQLDNVRVVLHDASATFCAVPRPQSVGNARVPSRGHVLITSVFDIILSPAAHL